MTQPPMGAPVPLSPIRAGFGIDAGNPALCKLRLETGSGAFELVMATAEVVGFLRGLADAADQQIAQTSPIARPVPGLFLPNGRGPTPRG